MKKGSILALSGGAKLLTVEEVSQLTGWQPMTIYRKSLEGTIPGRIKLGEKSVRFRENDIISWLRGGRDE